MIPVECICSMHSNLLPVYFQISLSANVLQMVFCAVDFSQQKWAKHGHCLLTRGAHNSGIPCLHFDKLDISGTVECGDMYFFLYQKRQRTGTVLLQVQFLGLRIKSLNISDHRKTLSSRKYFSPSRNVLQRSPPEKKGV